LNLAGLHQVRNSVILRRNLQTRNLGETIMQDFIKKELKVGCMLAPINIPIGMVIVYLITALFMGSFNE
jgi:hypothetical protein